MGTAAQHQAKAEHNLTFLDSISDEFPDWLVIVAFYVAVHLIERLFADRDRHSKSHEDRKRIVKQDFQSIFKPYHALYNAALTARYQSKERQLDVAHVRKELIDERLDHIRKFVASHSGSAKK